MSKNFELMQQAGKEPDLRPAPTREPAPTVNFGNGNGKSHRESDGLDLDLLAGEEALRLVQRVFLLQAQEPPRVVVFAGVDRGNGCSEICAQVADVLAKNIKGFFAGAFLEELGWSSYVIDPMQNRLGALLASVLVGLVWSAFHYVALLQAHRSLEWIAWWSLWTVALRVIIVWLYNNTCKSVFAAALFHTTINVTWQLFPIRGSFFDPHVTGLITAILAAAVVAIWGPRTLAGRVVILH